MRFRPKPTPAADTGVAATVAQLGARALRKLGVSVVAYGDAKRPGAGPTMTASEVAGLAVRQLGIVVPETDRPALTVTVTPDDMAARALRAVGVNPIAGGTAAAGTATVADIAARAQRLVGVNPADLGAAGTGGTSTRALLGTRTLLKLGVIASDETPLAPDQAEAESKVAGVHDQLVALDYVAWTVDAVPDRAAEWYIVLAANLLAAEFGKPSSAESYETALQMLRMQALSGATSQARAEAKVATVHNDLAAAGLVDWDLQTIPLALAEAYAAMVAQLLAPVFGKPQDMEAYGAAEAKVRRAALSGARGQALALSKVEAVHNALVAAGLVSWELDATPQAFAEDVVTMAATLVAPVMGKSQAPADRQADQAAWEAAEGRIRRAALIATAQDRAAAKVRAAFGELTALGLVDYDIFSIPGAVADAMAGLAAAELGPDFGKEETPDALAARWMRIKRMAMSGAAGQALAEQKVRAVHYSLEARGRTRWSLFDLPPFAEEAYVLMAAALLAPEVEMKADPAWGPGGERNLIEINSVPTNYLPVRASYF